MTKRESSRFYRVRVGVLLVILVGVVLYALNDVRSRNARKTWDHTLAVAVVLLRLGPVDEDATAALRARLGELETRLTDEMHRYRPGAPPPFAFTLFGPIDVAVPPPTVGDGALAFARHAYELWRYVRQVDASAKLEPSAFDSRIYVAARPPKSAERSMVEGASEQNGRIGTVEVELDAKMVDVALVVVAHELFHTLGATDKYDAAGHTLIPSGLAEPDRRPTFPQPFLDVMTRNRLLSETEEQVPETLDELAVGPATAREIAWAR